jgi:membrane-associated protein
VGRVVGAVRRVGIGSDAVQWFHQYIGGPFQHAVVDPIQHFLLGHGGVVAYLLVFGLVFAEDALFAGFVIPGETAAVLGGVLASRGSVNLGIMIGVVVVAAIVGDSVGYEVGHYFGSRLMQLRPLRAHQHRLQHAQDFVRDHGAPAVFLGRFVAFFRATVPGLAGMSHMPYRRFLPWNAVGGLMWGSGFVLLGWLAGNSFARIEKTAGLVSAIVVAAVVVVALVIWAVRRHRREAEEELAVDAAGSRSQPETPE